MRTILLWKTHHFNVQYSHQIIFICWEIVEDLLNFLGETKCFIHFSQSPLILSQRNTCQPSLITWDTLNYISKGTVILQLPNQSISQKDCATGQQQQLVLMLTRLTMEVLNLKYAPNQTRANCYLLDLWHQERSQAHKVTTGNSNFLHFSNSENKSQSTNVLVCCSINCYIQDESLIWSKWVKVLEIFCTHLFRV